MSLLHLSLRDCVYLNIISLSACEFRYPVIYFVLYVTCVCAHGPSWHNESIYLQSGIQHTDLLIWWRVSRRTVVDNERFIVIT